MGPNLGIVINSTIDLHCWRARCGSAAARMIVASIATTLHPLVDGARPQTQWSPFILAEIHQQGYLVYLRVILAGQVLVTTILRVSVGPLRVTVFFIRRPGRLSWWRTTTPSS